MRLVVSFFIAVLMAFTTKQNPGFKDIQLEHYTVFQAYKDKAEEAYAKLKAQDIDHFNCQVFIRAFKFEEDVEVWAKNIQDSTYKLITTYKFCNNVGELGPKRKEGDMQIPEGFYSVSKFNPTSVYFLSLKIDYPNESDVVFADKRNPGGMIFVHGGCTTVGCIPITDEWIKELYVFCVEAKNNGQEDIPIHIFPARLTNQNYTLLTEQYRSDYLTDFWGQLKQGYAYFETHKKPPVVKVQTNGVYRFH